MGTIKKLILYFNLDFGHKFDNDLKLVGNGILDESGWFEALISSPTHNEIRRKLVFGIYNEKVGLKLYKFDIADGQVVELVVALKTKNNAGFEGEIFTLSPGIRQSFGRSYLTVDNSYDDVDTDSLQGLIDEYKDAMSRQAIGFYNEMRDNKADHLGYLKYRQKELEHNSSEGEIEVGDFSADKPNRDAADEIRHMQKKRGKRNLRK